MMNLNFADVCALNEDQARAYLEKVRWPNGAACPRCGDMSVYLMGGKSTRPGLYKCRGCRKPFTVTIGTIFERSHIKLRIWLMAFSLICSSKKGISALQLQRQLGLKSYKSAWFMAHRIRHVMRQEPLQGMLRGTVEVDETYVGGKPRNKDSQDPAKRTRKNWSDKTPVMVLLQRDGDAISFPVRRVNAQTLKGAINLLVERGSTVYTDEHAAYQNLVGYKHDTTNHSRHEYLRGLVHSNTAESYFSLLKRGIMGSFHHVSVKHLHRYCDEFSFRWNYRKDSDAARTAAALKAADGKRLTYAPLTYNLNGVKG